MAGVASGTWIENVIRDIVLPFSFWIGQIADCIPDRLPRKLGGLEQVIVAVAQPLNP